MEKLISGVAEFQKKEFVEKEKLFESLATGQSPEVLFITCADSRIDPSMITQTLPGDLFICRNAGNIVPPHSNATGGMTASIEFAVAGLGVKHIVICGHTDCGAMKGALNPDAVKSLPHVAKWLSHCAAAQATVKARHPNKDDQQLLEMTEENVLLQLKHLETHPCVAEKLATGSLELHGWVYGIGDGSVTCYDQKKQAFIPIDEHYSSN
ncbi:MAG: carbonic anhydrase [Gammaproteobacteria bacterium]|nr:carbonic anhydrase [Gammaproteobacteria bacterium]MDH5591338.1 carbonic anhydrase [Gammaproteobacteria bacterium]